MDRSDLPAPGSAGSALPAPGAADSLPAPRAEGSAGRSELPAPGAGRSELRAPETGGATRSDLTGAGPRSRSGLPAPGTGAPLGRSELPAPGTGAPLGRSELPAPGTGAPLGRSELSGPIDLPARDGRLPAPDLPQRNGASSFGISGAAPFAAPEAPAEGDPRQSGRRRAGADNPGIPGPNPYRADPSEHGAPDPFRAGGPDVGPNPYSGRRGERTGSLGGDELFAAPDRPNRTGAPPAPPVTRSRPGGGDGSQLPPVPGLSGSRSPRRSRAAARGGDGADGTLPPAPDNGEHVRLSIFEDLQSEWFVQRDEAATAGPKAPSWQMAADDGWRAAARLAEPTTAGTTTAGLPRRRPQAMAVPGAVGGALPGVPELPRQNTPHRSPQEMRGRLSSYADGVRRGRHAERPADD